MRIEWFFVVALAFIAICVISVFVFNFMKVKGNKKVRLFLLNGINTPLKRIGFIIFIIGIMLLTIFSLQSKTNIIDTLYHSLLFIKKSYYFDLSIFISFYISLTGFFLSFLYDQTLNKIKIWIFKK